MKELEKEIAELRLELEWAKQEEQMKKEINNLRGQVKELRRGNE